MLAQGIRFELVLSAPAIEERLGQIMAALDDLKTAVSDLNASVSSEIAAVTAAIKAAGEGNSGAVSAADAEAIVTQLQGVKKTIDSETAALTKDKPAPGPVSGP
jgi:outer membrane murein-binding lipoprotein Lpp